MAPTPIVALDGCPLCAGRSLDTLPTPGHWVEAREFARIAPALRLRRCRSCGFVFVNPRPGRELLERYYQRADAAAHAGAGARKARAQLALIARYARLPARPRLLDFGCGPGLLLDVARGDGWDVVGFDLAPRARDACRARGHAIVDRLDAVDAGSFDVVTMSHVFEHLDDPDAVLGACRRALAPGGLLSIEVPNAGSLRARLSLAIASRRLGFDERYRAFPVHLSYFTSRTLRRALESRGFAIRGLTTVGLGVDELRPQRERDDDAPPPPIARARRSLGGRLLRRAFYQLRLGENLVAVAMR